MSKKIYKITGYLFIAIIAVILLVFITLQLNVHDDYSIMNDELNALDGPWTIQYEGHEDIETQLPLKMSGIPVNTPVSATTVLPEINDEYECLCIHAAEQDIEIYIDGVLRESYNDESTRLFGSYSAAAFIMLDLTHEDSNKEVTIVYTTSVRGYTGHISKIFLDTRSNVVLWMLDRYGMQSISALIIVLLGVAYIVVDIIMHFNRKRERGFIYIGLFALFYGLSALCQSNAKQMYFPNLFAANAMVYISLIICMIPLVMFMNYIQEKRHRKIYIVLNTITYIYFFVAMALQLLEITDLINLINITYINIGIIAITITALFIYDFVHGKGRETGLVLIGIVLLVAVTMVEIINMFMPGGFISGKYQNVGVILFICVLGASNIRELIIKKNEYNMVVQKNKLKDQFLANFSHEIRTPINTILGMNEMILRESDGKNIKEYADNINKAGTILLDMVGDVLNFSRIESGQNEIICENYSLKTLLEKTTSIIKCKAEEKELKYSVECKGVLHDSFYGDKKHIQQILINLLTNAVKYTKNGSVELRVEEIEDTGDDCILQFTVADTGIGIREKDIPTIFESFTRVDENVNSNVEGTGLGLSITRNLVDAMNGNIKADSKYGVGSTFTVRIPQKVVVSEESTVTKEEADNSYIVAPEARILIVDDNKMNLIVFRNLLKRTSIKVDAVTNATDCLTLTAMREYDIIFMDHMMPDIDGIETFHRLRNQENGLNKHCPVIALTANVIKGAEEMYLEEGFDGYLAKPFTGVALDKLIIKYLFNKRQGPDA